MNLLIIDLTSVSDRDIFDLILQFLEDNTFKAVNTLEIPCFHISSLTKCARTYCLLYYKTLPKDKGEDHVVNLIKKKC